MAFRPFCLSLCLSQLKQTYTKVKHHVDALNRLFWYCFVMETIPASVLVIESHPMMRAALCNAIAEEPDLTIAEPVINGAEASQVVIAIKPDTILLTYKPDLILLTLGNPGLDDLETLSILRRSLPDIPILALTSNEVDGQEQAALRAGAQAVLTKAAPRTELIGKLRELWMKEIMNHSEVNLEKETNGTNIAVESQFKFLSAPDGPLANTQKEK
jgi:DNA-binding NarL/FixJ family response regulator